METKEKRGASSIGEILPLAISRGMREMTIYEGGERAGREGQKICALERFHGAFTKHANFAPETLAEFGEPFIGLIVHLLLVHYQHSDVTIESNLTVNLELQVPVAVRRMKRRKREDYTLRSGGYLPGKFHFHRVKFFGTVPLEQLIELLQKLLPPPSRTTQLHSVQQHVRRVT